MTEEENPENILNTYKAMVSDCQQMATKIGELTLERDEHGLVLEQLSKLEGSRKAYRLVGGVLVERTVAEVLPPVQANFDGISQLVTTIDANLKKKDLDTKEFKQKHGIMTQSEREALMKGQQRAAAN
jgi:prefoldin subunit 2